MSIVKGPKQPDLELKELCARYSGCCPNFGKNTMLYHCVCCPDYHESLAELEMDDSCKARGLKSLYTQVLADYVPPKLVGG